MKKIFISYANSEMAYSLKRIGRQANRLGIFDAVLLFTPDDLPSYITHSPLMAHNRGAGYWVWKPAIIWETLRKYGDNSIVVYADAGCSLYSSEDWQTYFAVLEECNTLCFEYQDEMPEWEVFGQTSTKIKYWTKQATLDYFQQMLEDKAYGEKYNKIWGGLLFCRGKDNHFVRDWLKIMLEQPDLIVDPDPDERAYGNNELAHHKHDQCVLTALAHLHTDDVQIMDAKMETERIAAVVGSRIRVKNYFAYSLLQCKGKMRELLGKDTYNYWKAKFKHIITSS